MLAISPALTAAASMTALGLLFGVGLVLAARAFRTDENPRLQQVMQALPGINCGACGYAGCRGYAESVCAGEDVNLCLPGGEEVTRHLADIMGVEVADLVKKRAVVHCQGGTERCPDRFEYHGEADCHAAHLTSGGPKGCIYGCLGFGSCARACPFDAITMNDRRLPVINPDKCTACGICVETCPRDLITLLPARSKIYLGCSSHYRGKAVKDVCSVGCIACRLCEKKDPNEAIVMEDQLPVLDHEKADGDFSVAAEVCPMDCFVVETAPAREQTPQGVTAG